MNMQNEKTLIELGFKRHPEWDSETTESPNYRLEFKGLIFRAHVWNEKQGYRNEHQFVGLGVVIKDTGLVDRWRDCCSNGSVKRKIDIEVNKQYDYVFSDKLDAKKIRNNL